MSSAALGVGAVGGSGGEALRGGHSLETAALADGKLVDARPLGTALKAVLSAMLDNDIETPMMLLDGARHVAVTLGSAGIILACARPAPSPRGGGGHVNTSTGDSESVFLESPSGSGRWFLLSAEHYPALPLEQPDEGDDRGVVTNCTGAGDCLVAGMVSGLALGWSAEKSVFLGLVSAAACVIVSVFSYVFCRVVSFRPVGCGKVRRRR